MVVPVGVANGDVAYGVCGMTRVGLVDIFEEMGLGSFFIGLRVQYYRTSSRCCGGCARPHGNVILLSNAGETGEVAVAGGSVI
jgi:hypothetical protein